MNVDYIDHMGSDLAVVNAARVSFNKHHDVFDEAADTRLIDYLARNGHWTPFAHPQVQLRVTVPLFVAAQLKRHVVGASVNEVSRRYVDSEPEFESLVWRKRPDKSIKQGSAGDLDDEDQRLCTYFARTIESRALYIYAQLLDKGVAPEQARAVLPQTMHTSWCWTGSLYFWANLCRQRLHPYAQKETRDVALEIQDRVRPLFPVSWERLMEHAWTEHA